jgi:hypothetical protein
VVLSFPLVLFLVFKINKLNQKKLKNLIFPFFILMLLISPLILFDLKHQFVNTKGFIDIFKSRSDQGFSLGDVFSRSRDRLRQLFSLFLGFSERDWKTNLTVFGVLAMVLVEFIRHKKAKFIIIYSWFFWGILSLGFYRESFYPHYFGFLFPLPALLVGQALTKIYENGKKIRIVSLLLFFLFIVQMLRITWQDLSRPPVLNIRLVQKIVRLIQKESNNEQFNFALLANNNYDDSYRYFFRLWQIPAVYQTEVSRQLFVVCEDENICHPQGNPKWEIALFDAAYNGKIAEAGQWQPDPLVKVFKFVPAD